MVLYLEFDMIFIFILLASISMLSCSQKTRTLSDYEKENPYPAIEKKEEGNHRGSIFARGNGMANLYSETRAINIGDVIFIEVVESINALETVTNNTGRRTKVSQALSAFFGKTNDTLTNMLNASGELSSQGTGRIQQRGILTTKLAGRVMKVYPNGTMLIEAKKYIAINDSQKLIVLRGIVRPEDIDSGNTVPSNRIANMEVILDGKGFLVDGGKPGWLTRFFAKVLPF